MSVKLKVKFKDIVDLDNLLKAWKEFVCGKRSRKDVQEFELNLMGNIITLHRDLVSKTYKHDNYLAFNISDPKPRNIHKATVKDRILHRALYRQLYPCFDKKFVFHSFSCRNNKGTHKALKFFQSFFYQVSQNNTKTCWVLKGDIKKFFANIDHQILLQILEKYISDLDVLWLLGEIIDSFSTKPGIGLPLGNLTSQLLVNIYLNEFDQFVKHKLKTKHYLRYADDFVLISMNKNWLEQQVPLIKDFFWQKLKLTLHPQKISIKTIASGVDYLGWVNFPDHKILRTSTKRRLTKRIKENPVPETIASYLGLLKHGNTHKLRKKLKLAD